MQEKNIEFGHLLNFKTKIRLLEQCEDDQYKNAKEIGPKNVWRVHSNFHILGNL